MNAEYLFVVLTAVLLLAVSFIGAFRSYISDKFLRRLQGTYKLLCWASAFMALEIAFGKFSQGIRDSGQAFFDMLNFWIAFVVLGALALYPNSFKFKINDDSAGITEKDEAEA